MRPPKADILGVYPQRKNHQSSAARSKSKEISTKHVQVVKNEDSGVTSPGFDNEGEELLRQFDMDIRYGPCLGVTRLERWERAKRLSLQPPEDVKEVLDRVESVSSCLWEGRI
eukprot:c22880_g1_i1 orf=144-482(+)